MSQRILEGKIALVTGASHGIGMGCARALAEDGATVVIMGRSEEALNNARTKLVEQISGARIEAFVGDATKEDQIKAALAFTQGLTGRLDILVPAVGGPNFMPLLMRDVEGVRQEIDMNFTSVFMIVRYGVPLMDQGGSIVCISSTSTNQAWWGLSIYSAAKAALERFVRAAAFELGSAGIRINAVRPGPTIPEEDTEKPEFTDRVKFFSSETPLGRIGYPDDIGRVVSFLANPDSGWVTGQSFSVDGGQDQCRALDIMDRIYGKDAMSQIRMGKPVEPNS